MSEMCPYCGTELGETNWGRKHCPNCGIIEEDKDSSEENLTGSYIG